MATIVTRSGKGSPLTNTEVDSNFTNLNTDKVETSAIGTAAAASVGDFATAAQGITADSAVQPNDSPMFGVVTATSFAGDGSALTGLPAGYTNSDVDTHLNISTAANGEVLSWTGTDYDWVATGVGPQGPAGADGADGADSTLAGPTGPTGPQGPAGADGADGADSTVAGPQGPTGPAGADSTVAGPAGSDGADSIVAGPQGIQGETGPPPSSNIDGGSAASVFTAQQSVNGGNA